MAISDVALRKAKPLEKPYRLSDGGGLYVIVRPNGAKWWRFDYAVNNTRKTISLGTYPKVGLADARGKRNEALKLVAANVDPVEHERAVKQAATSELENTFRKIAEEYLEIMRGENRTAKTMAKNEWLLLTLASELHDKPIKTIRAAEILTFLKRIEATGRVETAHRLRAVISAVFRLAIRTDRAETDPTQALRGVLVSNTHTPQPAIIEENAFGRLLRNVDEYDGWPTLRAAMQIMALCYPRPIELRKCEWSHIDLKARVWNIPKHLTKMRRAHAIPLSRQAVAIFEQLRGLALDTDLVFHSIRNTKRPLSENAMNAALRRMGYEKEEHSSHGFRASASSILNERGFRYDVIEASLAHLDDNEVRRTYNRTAYLKERTEVAQAWADICDELKQPPRNNSDLI